MTQVAGASASGSSVASTIVPTVGGQVANQLDQRGRCGDCLADRVAQLVLPDGHQREREAEPFLQVLHGLAVRFAWDGHTQAVVHDLERPESVVTRGTRSRRNPR